MQRDAHSACTAHLPRVPAFLSYVVFTQNQACVLQVEQLSGSFLGGTTGGPCSFSPNSPRGWLPEMEVSQDWFMRPPALACGWPSSPTPSYGRLAVGVWVLISSYLTSCPRLAPTLKVSFHSISSLKAPSPNTVNILRFWGQDINT